jgi:hypothetical protein
MAKSPEASAAEPDSIASAPAANADAPLAKAAAVSTACTMAFFRAAARFFPKSAGPETTGAACAAAHQVIEIRSFIV